jgi:hypothetical protein
MRYSVEYEIEISDPIKLPYDDAVHHTFRDLQLDRNFVDKTAADIVQGDEFKAEWFDAIANLTVQYLAIDDVFDDCPFYLGKFEDGTLVAVPGNHMDNYGTDITYNGYYVKVTAYESASGWVERVT